MRYAQRGYLLLLNGMALLAAIMLVWLMVAVVLSVVIRNLGLQPSAWFFCRPSTPCSTSRSWGRLVGTPKGHVHIELLTSVLPPAVLNVLSRGVSLLCVVVCGVLAWKGVGLGHDEHRA